MTHKERFLAWWSRALDCNWWGFLPNTGGLVILRGTRVVAEKAYRYGYRKGVEAERARARDRKGLSNADTTKP